MREHWELLVGLAALAAAFWQQANNLISWAKGWVIVSRKTDWETGQALLGFMNATMKTKIPASAAYGSDRTYVRPLERVYRVFYQSSQGARQTFRRRAWPVWFTPHNANNNETGPDKNFVFEFTYVRGTYDWEKMLLSAAAWEDELRSGLSSVGSRFAVHYHYGTAGMMGEMLAQAQGSRKVLNDAAAAPVSGGGMLNPTAGTRLLQWTHDDVQAAPIIATIDNLSLRPELMKLVDELKFWHTSKVWYQKHGVPWRRGCLLFGAPGTGKTSFVRATAELLDLPVHVFDLASMSNQDLKRAWQHMMLTSPCIALLEDLDAVFEGRKNVAPQSAMSSGVTYDTLLNCIDGIERVDGMLLFITTNNLDKLDTALTDRPGRIDSTVEFQPLDHEGRVKMAARILDNVELAVKIAQEGLEDSAAKFQERCFRVALARRYDERAS